MSAPDLTSTDQPHPWLSRFLAPRGCDSLDRLCDAVAGKVVLVTGASRGIGRTLSLQLSQAGATVLVAARHETDLFELASHIDQQGGHAYVYCLDLRNPQQIEQQAQRIREDHGGVDIVVHNAGKSIRRSIMASLDRAHDFERTMSVNYLGPVRLQLALLPSMIARGGGLIVNVSTIGVQLPPAIFWAAYSASKIAFDTWMGSIAPEVKRYGIDCSRVYLGLVHTAMSAPTASYRKLPGQTAEQAAQVLCRAIIERPRRLAPWWIGPLNLLRPALDPLFDRWQRNWGPKTPDDHQ